MPSCLDERTFRSLLGHAPISPDDYDREVRLVRAAVEGRIVWTTVLRWRVYCPDSDEPVIETPDGAAKPNKADLVAHFEGASGDGRCRIVPVKITRRTVRKASSS